MKPRITINTTKDGTLEIWINEAGRDLLVKELNHLSQRNDHFHFGPDRFGGEVPLQSQAYHDGDQVMEWGKVLFRRDDWDAQYFPHVMRSEIPSNK